MRMRGQVSRRMAGRPLVEVRREVRPTGKRHAVIVTCGGLVVASLTLLAGRRAMAAESGPANSRGPVAAAAPRVGELTGSVPPSILVPPVRTVPPSRTLRIERPPQYDPAVTERKKSLTYRLESLRLAIEDLAHTYGDAYPGCAEYLRRWAVLWEARDEQTPRVERDFEQLRGDALLANPLLECERLLVLKRRRGQLGLPTNHQCNTSLKQLAYNNELAVLSPVRPDGRLHTVYRPTNRAYVGEMDLHPAADRLLFTMPNGRTWQIHEIGLDGQHLRQVSREVADVDNFDPCYLPNGRIVFASTAAFTGVPCWHGRERACCLYSMAADGSDVRQLCYDQDLDLNPSVLANGQVIYSRWDYTGILHAYVRPLMVMNPDGTGQRATYGSNSYYPNSLFFPRAVPGASDKIVAILAGYHGSNRSGELAVLDISHGWNEAAGVLYRMTHRGEPIVPVARDFLTQDAIPQFLHPYPLSDKYVLAAMQSGKKQPWGIYLVDVFDNVVPLLTDPKWDYFEPLPVQRRAPAQEIPDRTDSARDDAVIILHDIYRGPGLRGVPRGTIKSLRIAAYHFGYPGLAGPDKIGRSGPWEVMRILGTVPVYEDGSAKFRVPAGTPITLQPLDAEGKAVQLMRSWYTAMPGETTSCVGCHETPHDAPIVRTDLAAGQPVAEIQPWYGPARGFDFAREVQPVLDAHCVACHDGAARPDGTPLVDLRDERFMVEYEGLPLTRLGATRLEPALPVAYPERFRACAGMPEPLGEIKTRYTPAYEALIPYIRRVNIEDGAELLVPGEYHADTSELIQILQKDHYGVRLDRESWDRLVTWIDLNGPCHGTWADVAAVPASADRRRRELARTTRGPTLDPESIPPRSDHRLVGTMTADAHQPDGAQKRLAAERLEAQAAAEPLPDTPAKRSQHLKLDLGEAVGLDLLWVPPGRFVMGDTTGAGAADEWPAAVVTVARGFWIGRTEVTNAQLQRLLPEHDSGVFTKRQVDRDGPGIQLAGPQQPATRVSWDQAWQYCRELSARTNRRVTLPTEAQWEYAARAGTRTDWSYGPDGNEFERWGNMADRSLACLYEGTAGVAVLQPIPAVLQQDDQAIGTAVAGSYEPNAWGLHDMHGNVAEWTRSVMRPYPYDTRYDEQDGQNTLAASRRVVRGGSFYDRPYRCRSAYRLAFPSWQAVHNVGFRIVVEE